MHDFSYTHVSVIRSHRNAVTPYTTKDGSEIRELMHPTVHGNQRQSLAEASVPAGGQTQLHRHAQAEELYCILDGAGQMQLGAESFMVQAGDTVCIPPATAHCIRNTGKSTLRFLCCCAPAYSHDDTELLAE
ncbi:MAG: cupin domain-containing protein [Gammaproteobacteria bacterium]|nr:MAG: cupin domain-containing protein [Gammaproteobacteria bacterium]